VQFAGEIKNFDPASYMDPKDARRSDRFTQIALAARIEALTQSGLVIDECNAYDVGVIFGAGVGGVGTYTKEFEVMYQKGVRRVSPFLVPSITIDVPSVQLALYTGAQGPNLGIATACATGSDTLGQAYETIRRGHARVIISGSCESAITPIAVATFCRMQALSRRNEDPGAASRPFDSQRDGFVMAEGAAVLIVEDLEYARQRGAQPLAEIVGYAATSDAVHLAAPQAEGVGVAKCMQLALDRAGLTIDDVDYINAHGTSTPAGDAAETRAIKQAFGEKAYNVPISSTKSMTGHLMGGAGSVEAVFCIKAIHEGILPPTINLTDPDPLCDLDYVPLKARNKEVNLTLSNSMGFGGHNATLLIKRFEN
jgi:beta-ketoacyl-acyl-carrier-protein synthase II